MNRGPQQKSDWFTPSTLFGALGFIAMLLSAYLTFQRDVGVQVGALSVRVAVLEAKIDDLRARAR